jgi:hypothetical protein
VHKRPNGSLDGIDDSPHGSGGALWSFIYIIVLLQLKRQTARKCEFMQILVDTHVPAAKMALLFAMQQKVPGS